MIVGIVTALPAAVLVLSPIAAAQGEEVFERDTIVRLAASHDPEPYLEQFRGHTGAY